MDNSKITELLGKFGLNDREANIYLTLLKSGPKSLQQLAKLTDINRTTLYTLLPNLFQAGVIKKIKENKRELLSPASPEELFCHCERKYKEIKENIEELNLLYRMQGLNPKIQTLDSTEHIKKLFLDSLFARQVSMYIRIDNCRPDIKKWLKEIFFPEIEKKDIDIKIIVVASDSTSAKTEYDRYKAKFRFISSRNYQFANDSIIYDDRISYFICDKGEPPTGIIIESKLIAEAQKSSFELAWIGLRKS